MIYKFKSKASSDLLMMGPQGDRLLELLGRPPSARGIIEPSQMPAALAALRAAIAATEGGDEEGGAKADVGYEGEPGVSLKRRLWPMITMLERAAAADVPIVWGV